jgi:hypothetical protein
VSFVTVSALAIALLVVIPVIAHLLQRGGRTPVAFSLARLVEPRAKLATRKSRFADRVLFAVRALLLTTLALLGAAPLIRCNRPTLTRPRGASVALAIVLDDSASMRAHIKNGAARFELAKHVALQLISELREGDLVTLVLAGRPARVLVGATPQLGLAAQLCRNVKESDRGTDLTGALDLAENSLQKSPQVDRRVAVLSDMGQKLEKVYADLWLPLPALTTPVQDCGVVTASQLANQVDVMVACTDAGSNTNRKLSLVPARGSGVQPSSLPIAQKLEPIRNVQSLVFKQVPTDVALVARLDGSDDNSSNDAAPVFAGISGTVIATLSDYTTSRPATGGPPLVEQALAAVGGQIIVRPWSALPEDEHSYSDVSLLILDDPSGFGPEVRAPLVNWLSRGGVAVAFLGARAVSDQLGVTLSPFLEGSAVWSPIDGLGFDPVSLKWLGATGTSWSDIHARARLEFDQAAPAETTVRGRWQDGRLSLFESRLGRGLAWTIGLPASTNISDLALRPALLALLDHVVETARHRGLSAITAVGNAWKTDAHDTFKVLGPDGTMVPPGTPSGVAATEIWYTPTLSGIYKFQIHGEEQLRIAHIEPDEILEPPHAALIAETQRHPSVPSLLELSPYLVAAILALLLLELLARSGTAWLTPIRDCFHRLKPRRSTR